MNDTQNTIKTIQSLATKLGEIKIMELCGSHSQTVARFNIKSILPPNIKLISGPGCPICVTDQEDIDIVVGLAMQNIPIAIYGDTLSLPGSTGSLEKTKQLGKKIFIVYSTVDAVKLKDQYPNLVFFAIGFETTTPMTAWAIKQGLTVYCTHKLFPPAMELLLQNKDLNIDAFINPGHVSAIIGTSVYNNFDVPQVITGFEPEDVIESIKLLLELLINKENKVINQYTKVVKPTGNLIAQQAIRDVFEEGNGKWRGLGTILHSGLQIKERYKKQDAKYIYKDLIEGIKKNVKPQISSCICGKILQGVKESKDCPLFNTVCNPENPQGACMVSAEGECRIQYTYKK
jgi:hydrogenase expression/formation protein HypD